MLFELMKGKYSLFLFKRIVHKIRGIQFVHEKHSKSHFFLFLMFKLLLNVFNLEEHEMQILLLKCFPEKSRKLCLKSVKIHKYQTS